MKEQETVFLKPGRSGLIVRDPITLKPLDEKGESKPRNSYWLRRIRCGDAIASKASRSSGPKTEGTKSKAKKGDDQ